MISDIRSSSSSPASRPARPQQSAPAAEPQDKAEVGWLARTGGTIAGAGAGTAGVVYGAGKGLVNGTIATPAVTKKGIEIGANALRPAGQVAGCVAASACIGLAGTLGVIGTVGGTLAGGIAGGASSLVEQGPKLTRACAETCGRAGVTVGSAVLGAVGGVLGTVAGLCTLPTILYPPLGLKLIPQAVRGGAVGGFQAGATAGRYVGGALGGLTGGTAGLAASVAMSVPAAAKGALAQGAKGVEFLKNMPQLSSEMWNGAKEGFGDGAAAIGGTLGAVVGAGTAAVNVPWQGLAQAAETGLDWGSRGYHSVAG